MDTVRSILGSKGSSVISVSPESTLDQALKVMSDHNVGAVVVLDAEGRLMGIFSERDFARKIGMEGRSIAVTKVKELMTSAVFTIMPDTSISDCMSLMTEKRIRHLPVVANGRLMGLISIGDVVKALFKAQEETITEQARQIGQLNNYITGSP
jgi:CBS domain-containing protein